MSSPESKYVSLETAKRLKAEGFPQDTERWWTVSSAVVSPDAEYHLTSRPFDWGQFHKIAAPDAQEILELLPRVVEPGEDVHGYEMKVIRPTKTSWAVRYHDDENGVFDVWNHESLVEAAAFCWLWLKEQKLI